MTDFKEHRDDKKPFQKYGPYYDPLRTHNRMKPLLMGPVWLLIFLFFHFMITFLWSLLRLFRLLTGSRRSLHRRFASMASKSEYNSYIFVCLFSFSFVTTHLNDVIFSDCI